jgi:transketolase
MGRQVRADAVPATSAGSRARAPRVDGHDITDIDQALTRAESSDSPRPIVILAHTINDKRLLQG